MRSWGLTTVALLLAACTSAPAGDRCSSSVWEEALALAPPPTTDLLVVVDPTLDAGARALVRRRSVELARTMLDGDADRDGVIDFLPTHDLRALAISADPACGHGAPAEWIDARDSGSYEPLLVALDAQLDVRCGTRSAPLDAIALARPALRGAPDTIVIVVESADGDLAPLERTRDAVVHLVDGPCDLAHVPIESTEWPLCRIDTSSLASLVPGRGGFAGHAVGLCLPRAPVRSDGGTRCTVVEELGPSAWQARCEGVGRTAIDDRRCVIAQDRIEGWALVDGADPFAGLGCTGLAIQLGIQPAEGAILRVACVLEDRCGDGDGVWDASPSP